MKGIKQQIEESDHKGFTGVLSVEMIENFLAEIFLNTKDKFTEMEDCILPNRSKDEVYSWED